MKKKHANATSAPSPHANASNNVINGATTTTTPGKKPSKKGGANSNPIVSMHQLDESMKKNIIEFVTSTFENLTVGVEKQMETKQLLRLVHKRLS